MGQRKQSGRTGESESQSSASVYQDAKLIRRAYLQVQTETFDQAVQALEKMVAECGGYFQSASVEGGSLRNQNATRWGNYTIRLPQEQFDTFLGRTGELGYVTSQSENSENVSQQYYDTEARPENPAYQAGAAARPAGEGGQYGRPSWPWRMP